MADVEHTVTDTRHDTPQEATETIWAAMLRYKKVIGYVAVSTVSPLMFGFDNVIVGVVTGVPFFQ